MPGFAVEVQTNPDIEFEVLKNAETGVKTAYVYLDVIDDDVLPVLQQYSDYITIEYFE